MFKTLTDYNDCNNMRLSNEKIQEAMRKVIEQESISDSNNINADTFSHVSNKKGKNANSIFTNEKLDKSGELVDTVNNFTINDAKYY